VRDAAAYDVIVQEKLDGSCVAIVREGGVLVARGREGRPAAESGNAARREFATWVGENTARFDGVIAESEVLVGEWLLLVHGTRYELTHELFVPFDLYRTAGDGGGAAPRERLGLDVLRTLLEPTGLAMPGVVHRGSPIAIDAACTLLGEHGLHGAIDLPEGLVYRVERAGRVVTIAKWVRPGKIDGVYLPENSGQDARYHRAPR